MRFVRIALLMVLAAVISVSAARAWMPWLRLTSPCQSQPVGVGGDKYHVFVICKGENVIYYQDAP